MILIKQEDLISIIVPVYNTEKYLKKSIDSIINQTYKNIEIILVNDGSTDNSKKICEEYKKKDKRIRLINKENGGQGSAKNTGIQYATGNYIGFVDSDDYIDEDMYEVLYNLCIDNHAEISMIAFNKVIDGKIMKTINFNEEIMVLDKFNAMKELLLDREIKSYNWNKLYKKELFEEIKFSEELKYEDIEINAKLFTIINKLAYKKIPKYYYVQRNNSTVNCKSYNNLKDYVIVTQQRYDYLKERYKEIEKYNAIGFIANMTITYKNAVAYDIDELYEDFEKNYELFCKLTEKYKNDCLSEFNDYKRLLLSIILWNVELGKEIVKEVEKQIEKNRKFY